MLSIFLRIYAAIHMIFFILALYLLHRFSQDIATKQEYNSFRFLLWDYMLYLVMSVSCTFIEYGGLPLPVWMVWGIALCTILSVVLIVTTLYMFTVFRYAPEISEKKWFSALSGLPLLSILILLLSTLRSGQILDAQPVNHIIYSPLYPLLTLLAMPYFAAILIFAVLKYRSSRSFIQRNQLRLLMFAVLFVFASASLDMYFYPSHISILPTASLVSIIFLYVNMQDSGIYGDMLTGMNNRRRATEYLEALLPEVSEESPIYLYICDVNSFKKINDEHGHPEGDQALILTANAIKGAIAARGGFAARFGGDEFLLALLSRPDGAAEDDPETLIDDIRSRLAAACSKAHKPYSVTVSV